MSSFNYKGSLTMKMNRYEAFGTKKIQDNPVSR